MNYKISGYYDKDFRGLADFKEVNTFDEMVTAVHESCSNGNYVRAENTVTGAAKEYDPDTWMEAIELGDYDEGIKVLSENMISISIKPNEYLEVGKDAADRFMKKKPYGVSQSSHGHEYVWIFDEATLRNILAEYGLVDLFDIEMKNGSFWEDISWPMSGSNCSSTYITKFDSFKDACEFICNTCDGPDVEDPTLIEIAEYIRTVATDNDSITQEFLDNFLYQEADFFEKHDERYDELIDLGYTSKDMYGEMSDVMYSEVAGVKKVVA